MYAAMYSGERWKDIGTVSYFYTIFGCVPGCAHCSFSPIEEEHKSLTGKTYQEQSITLDCALQDEQHAAFRDFCKASDVQLDADLENARAIAPDADSDKRRYWRKKAYSDSRERFANYRCPYFTLSSQED